MVKFNYDFIDEEFAFFFMGIMSACEVDLTSKDKLCLESVCNDKDDSFFLKPTDLDGDEDIIITIPLNGVKASMPVYAFSQIVSLLTFSRVVRDHGDKEALQCFDALMEHAKINFSEGLFYVYAVLDIILSQLVEDDDFDIYSPIVDVDMTRLLGASFDYLKFLSADNLDCLENCSPKEYDIYDKYACLCLGNTPIVVTGSASSDGAVKRAKALAKCDEFKSLYKMLGKNYQAELSFKVWDCFPAPEGKVIIDGGYFYNKKLLAINVSGIDILNILFLASHRVGSILNPDYQFKGSIETIFNINFICSNEINIKTWGL